MSEPRTEQQVREEIQRVTSAMTAHAVTNEEHRLYEARLQELRRELRALDDTPILPYRPASVPPSMPRGRRHG